MTAYGFKEQFVEPLRAGTKIGTIRANGKRRHARPGDDVQLYCGMRRPGCFKIRPDVICQRVNEIEIHPAPLGYAWVRSNGVLIHTSSELDEFAVADGFFAFEQMVEFWDREHGRIDVFHGSHIIWGPLPVYVP